MNQENTKLQSIIQIWKFFDKETKKKFIFLQCIIIIASFLELLSIFSIGPFVSVLLGVITLDSIPFVGDFIVRYFSGIEIYILALITSLTILISNLFFSYTLYKKAKFSYTLGAETSNNILQSFISKKLNKEHYSKNKITSSSTFEADRFAKSVVNELIQINARLMVSVTIIVFLLFNYGTNFLFFLIYMMVIYISISIFLKEKLSIAGKNLTLNNQNRLRNVNDTYDSFYEIKSYNAEQFFINRHKEINNNISNNLANIELYSVLPRYLVEGIMLISLIGFLSYQYSLDTNINTMIPLATQLIYGIMRLIPQVSNIYQAYSNFSGNINSIDEVSFIEEIPLNNVKKSINVEKIILKDLSFYRTNNRVFDKYNYTFTKNNIYLIKGPSGIGKSTMLSLLFGLLKSSEGEIQFFDKNNQEVFNPKIAFIPQNHFLVYGNINSNIALGIDEDFIDNNMVNKILDQMKLTEFISQDIKEIKMSGGQIQRVCIGRYLYHNYDIVLFDEPTSALDLENEKLVFEIIKRNKENKIIIMVSHSEIASQYADEIIRLG
ncbi:ATP-binding cassette domain-containing protein [Poseidonibacter ostreae]|uniref:ATP-binding cassette domain-containing protein n=1 Tax=Poseidonibacter ostreae TaxID=2654171 RepID=A0A6L4WU55_9BACT|nr:ABC transporter ATP-binding protein [Poseidonibacter ostreae]KAB7889776.1 ATP-binding cassette domain-containing protein [Poseidonibacter ostreae]